MEPFERLAPHLRERLAVGLEMGTLAMDASSGSVQFLLGVGANAEEISTALRALQREGVSGQVVAMLLRSLSRTEARISRPDLVWSGPRVSGIHARETRRVFEELIDRANRSLIISTFAFFDGPKAFQRLARRMEAQPKLRVTLLLNIQRNRRDTTEASFLVRSFADRFWKEDWPGTLRPSVFYDPRSLDMEAPSSVLHAKAVVADDETVLITSANLTESAMDRNIELGLLVRDPALALSVAAHFRGLIETSRLSPLPSF